MECMQTFLKLKKLVEIIEQNSNFSFPDLQGGVFIKLSFGYELESEDDANVINLFIKILKYEIDQHKKNYCIIARTHFSLDQIKDRLDLCF